MNLAGKNILVGACFALSAAVAVPEPVHAGGVELEFETGVVFTQRNDASIPGDAGTRFSLADDLSTSPSPVGRLRLGYRIGDRHLLTALYAPLRLNATGTIDRDVEFLGATFPAGREVVAVYRFNSYRLTYRYSIVKRAGFEVAAGLTGKVRDAETSLYGVESRRKTNVGFVPLANVHVEWRPGNGRFGVMLDADALAAPQGRAEDILLAATWNFRDDVRLQAGYRMLEGGADNDEVYSFAWLHYAVAGLAMTF